MRAKDVVSECEVVSDCECVLDEKRELPDVTATEWLTPSACDTPCDSVCASDSVSATEFVVDANELLEWDCVTVWCAGVWDQDEPWLLDTPPEMELLCPSDTPLDSPLLSVWPLDTPLLSAWPPDSLCCTPSVALSCHPPPTFPIPPWTPPPRVR
ncbi:MAG: hypothetical protein GY842_18040, partial [bacterium]|nr:hypothetical protein [bacterium]